MKNVSKSKKIHFLLPFCARKLLSKNYRKKQLKMKYLTNLRSDQGVFPFRLADVDVVVVASTQTNRKFYNIKLSRYINA